MTRTILFRDGGWTTIHERASGWVVTHSDEDQPTTYTADTPLSTIMNAEARDRAIELVKQS
jgi:hypothetical protein